MAAALYLGSGPAEAALVGAAALLPDVDHPGSAAGRMAPGVSHVLRLGFGHRGFLHSLLGAACTTWAICRLAALLGLAVPWQPLFAGYLVHLVLDTFTPGGVPWLWPLGVRVSVPLVRTGSILERAVVVPVVLLFAVFGTASWL
ncbi:MAG: metal-dependent hydrolase [Moorellales bacterium]